MKTIITPIDFSDISLNAARYAISMAGYLKTSVTLFYVSPLPLSFSEFPQAPQILETMQQEAEGFMEKVKSDLQLPGSPIKIHTEVRSGNFLTTLIEFCEENPTSPVMMSSHGKAGLEHLLLGGNTSELVTSISSPLFVIPREMIFSAPKKILLTCDLEDVSTTISTDFIKELTQAFNSALSVLHVKINEEEPYLARVIDETKTLRLMLEDLHPSYHFVTNTNTTTAILDFIELNDFDLLIGFPKKHSFLEKLFHKSQSKALARVSTIPFLAIHGDRTDSQ